MCVLDTSSVYIVYGSRASSSTCTVADPAWIVREGGLKGEGHIPEPFFGGGVPGRPC